LVVLLLHFAVLHGLKQTMIHEGNGVDSNPPAIHGGSKYLSMSEPFLQFLHKEAVEMLKGSSSNCAQIRGHGQKTIRARTTEESQKKVRYTTRESGFTSSFGGAAASCCDAAPIETETESDGDGVESTGIKLDDVLSTVAGADIISSSALFST
jgi:hypothetical protein